MSVVLSVTTSDGPRIGQSLTSVLATTLGAGTRYAGTS
jgi:hypothetical protein